MGRRCWSLEGSSLSGGRFPSVCAPALCSRALHSSSKLYEPPLRSKLAASLKERREDIFTLPNAITVSRMAACPYLGYAIVQGNWGIATGVLAYAGLSDLLDGWLARRYNMGSVVGSILDPAADKLLMTTMVVALTMRDM